MVLVRLMDFLKDEDVVFYNDEMAIENLKAFNANNKEVKVEKGFSSYAPEYSSSQPC